MTDQPRRDDEPGSPTPPIDESTYAGSSAETGGLYDDAGQTTANTEGDTMSETEEEGGRPPEAPSEG